jgi:putative transcriptional regulator
MRRGDRRGRPGAAARAAAATFALALCAAAPAASPRDGAALLLVADPELTDPNFHQAVVLVTRRPGIAGPIGVVINRPSPVTLARAFPDVKSLAAVEDKVYVGGPVARQALFYVFHASAAPPDAVEVAEGVYLDWSGERLRTLLGREKPVEGLRVYAGHAAWSPGQLEAEVARGFWKSARADARSIFAERPETLWPELIRRAALTTVRREARAGDHRGGSP